jgi:flagella basal body P-ring formation protein FlgA
MIVSIGLLFAITTLPPCRPVQGEWITARDLAADNAVFTAIDPEAKLSHAPTPGTRRIFHADELKRLQRKFDLAVTALNDACFEWKLEPLNVDALRSAMAIALHVDPSAIQIVEHSRFPAPPGPLRFSKDELTAPAGQSGAALFWKGFVEYADQRRFPIWARVRISVPSVRIIALTALPAFAPIGTAQLSRVEESEPMSGGDWITRIEDAAGLVPRTAVQAGSALRRSQLAAPPDVRAGDRVRLQVINGPLHLTSEAKAEQSGMRGAFIAVTNPTSGKRFSARIEAPGQVSVVVAPVRNRGAIAVSENSRKAPQ